MQFCERIFQCFLHSLLFRVLDILGEVVAKSFVFTPLVAASVLLADLREKAAVAIVS